MYKIINKFDNANSWLKENFSQPPFNQSFDWEEILSREGKAVERLVVLKDNQPIAMALLEYTILPMGWRYAFSPRGPLILEKNLAESDSIINAIGQYLKEKKCIFLRMELKNKIVGLRFAFKPTIDINPRATLILSLLKTPEELLKNMHHKTRYNINLSQKRGVCIADEKDADIFYNLMKITAQRDGFRLHRAKHYHEIIFSPLSYQLTAYHREQPIASAVFVGFGDTFTYLFGASDYQYRSLMAPYLLQWEGIKLGQRFGYKYYDFFGIAPLTNQTDDQNQTIKVYDEKHQYAGVTRFKQGFGGSYDYTVGTYDLILSPIRYNLYKGLRFIRRII